MAALLLDENVPRSTGLALAHDGHDPVFVADLEPGANDERVLALARKAGRMLVTFDSDFGDLVFQQGHAAPPAIVLLRMHPVSAEHAAARAAEALRGAQDGWFIVVTRDAIRRRRLPATS